MGGISRVRGKGSDPIGGHWDQSRLIGACGVLAGGYLARQDEHGRFVAEVEQSRHLQEVGTSDSTCPVGVARLPRLAGTRLVRLGLSFRRSGPRGDGSGVWASFGQRRPVARR